MLLNKALNELSDMEFLVKYSIIYLNMRKIKDESIVKILEHEDTK